jgi:hypothetical protein
MIGLYALRHPMGRSGSKISIIFLFYWICNIVHIYSSSTHISH